MGVDAVDLSIEVLGHRDAVDEENVFIIVAVGVIGVVETSAYGPPVVDDHHFVVQFAGITETIQSVHLMGAQLGPGAYLTGGKEGFRSLEAVVDHVVEPRAEIVA